MKPETAKQISDAIIKALQDAGMPIERFASALIGSPLDEQSKNLLIQVVTNENARDLANAPEPKPEDLVEWFAMLDRFRNSPRAFREQLDLIRKGLPRTPGGPNRVIPPEAEAHVCADFDALLMSGCERPDALRRVARQREASVRTIYRILKKHGKTKLRTPRKQR
jgi:hypothetical protein